MFVTVAVWWASGPDQMHEANGGGASLLAYDAPEGSMLGDVCELPRPYFYDPRPEAENPRGTIVCLAINYEGRVKRVLRNETLDRRERES